MDVSHVARRFLLTPEKLFEEATGPEVTVEGIRSSVFTRAAAFGHRR